MHTRYVYSDPFQWGKVVWFTILTPTSGFSFFLYWLLLFVQYIILLKLGLFLKAGKSQLHCFHILCLLQKFLRTSIHTLFFQLGYNMTICSICSYSLRLQAWQKFEPQTKLILEIRPTQWFYSKFWLLKYVFRFWVWHQKDGLKQRHIYKSIDYRSTKRNIRQQDGN